MSATFFVTAQRHRVMQMSEGEQLWLQTFLSVLVFRKGIQELLSAMSRGFVLKWGNVSLSVKETGPRTGSVSITAKPPPPRLTELQIKILQEFIKRGDYDTLDVSKTLIGDFRQLKDYGFLRWEREEDKDDQVSLSKFGVTEEGKKKV